MAKEFDIYLNKRLTECDILVYSIPYRQCLSALDRLILETCLESYRLQKFISVKNGCDLVSHIDRMIKTCSERLQDGIALGSAAKFRAYCRAYPKETGVELSTECLELAARVYASAESVLQFASEPVDAYVVHPLDCKTSELILSSNVSGGNLTKYDCFQHAVGLLSALTETAAKYIVPGKNPIAIASEVNAVVRRARWLYEMDDGMLSDYDNMSLDDVDYVIEQK